MAAVGRPAAVALSIPALLSFGCPTADLLLVYCWLTAELLLLNCLSIADLLLPYRSPAYLPLSYCCPGATLPLT